MKPDYFLCCFSGCLLLGYLAVNIPTQAQITSDHSMPVPTQVIRQSDKLLEIVGGTEAGSNLFHSFAEFTVNEGNIARFINNNKAILNVIGRVTGSSASKIFGGIEAGGSSPKFNLFLLNPNGIIFGANASLDLKGSFVATTANAIQFGDRGFFSASSPNDPSLLTVQPSAFFFNQIRANSILNQSYHQIETESGALVPVGIAVPSDQSLLLLGGDVTLDGGMLTVPNGHIELGGLAGAGTVALKSDGNNLSLRFPDNVLRADVVLTNRSMVNVKDRGRGSIALNAQNIEITGVSKLISGILPNLVSSDGKTGGIKLQATQKVNIDNASVIGSRVDHGAIGDSGDISIEAESFYLLNGGFLYTHVEGRGDSGNININIRNNIVLKGRSRDSNAYFSQIDNRVLRSGEGKGGNITLNARSLSLADAAIIQTATEGKGNAGNISIQADDFVSLDNATGGNTQIRTAVEAGAVGDGGKIDLQSRSLSLTGGSALAASVFRSFQGFPGGKGKGGDIIVNASDAVTISGVGLNGYSSGIYASTEEDAVGAAGNITVNTRAFRIADGGVIDAQTSNSGSGGNIHINTHSFEALSGGQLLTNAGSSGNAGSIIVNASSFVTLSGSNPTSVDGNVGAASGLFTRSNDLGSAGNVTINTPQLILQEGGQISASSESSQGGNINLQGLDTLVINNSTITASTQTGRAGNLTIKAAQSVQLTGAGGLSVEATAGGLAGNLSVETGQITLSDQTKVSVSSPQGQAGNLQIMAYSLTLDQSAITAETGESGTEGGANIKLQLSGLLKIGNESLISAKASGAANGGNIDLDTLLLAVFPPTAANGSDIIAKAERGNGGNIEIQAQGIFGIAERQAIPGNQSNDIDASSEFGASGQVQINSTIDPNRGVIQLAETVVDPTDLIAQNLCRRGNKSQFTHTGRGGLPPSPQEDLTSLATQIEWVEPAFPSPGEPGHREAKDREAREGTSSSGAIATAIVPTQGWIFNDKGEVVLVAYDPSVMGSQRLRAHLEGCLVP